MNRPLKVTDGIYLVGGPELTDGRDCCVYLVDGGGELALIDTGLGPSAPIILNNIEQLGFNPADLKYVIATHGHADHIGGLYYFQANGAKIICHAREREAITSGNPQFTASFYYGITCRPVQPDVILTGAEEPVAVGSLTIHCLLTPGHTPGGISPYLDAGGTRVLFGQDIHGPFATSWGSNMQDWFASMQKLLDLEADILCEGHFGIYSPAAEVKKYIQFYMDRYAG